MRGSGQPGGSLFRVGGGMTDIVSNPPDLNVQAARAKAFVLLKEAGLTDPADRHDLSSFILGRRIKSWKELEPADWTRILDSLSGWFAVQHLRRERGLG